jgi:D-alanine-D-alanine ligase
MKGIARVDYIIDSNNTFFVIEINSFPGMSNESLVPEMVAVEGIGLEELFGELIKSSMFVKS